MGDPVIFAQPVATGPPGFPKLAFGANTAEGHMQMVPLNVPPGLEYLTDVSRLRIKQKIEALEIICGCETNNRYAIINEYGQTIFKAKEENDCLTRNCCGPIRPFDMYMKDARDMNVIHFSRPLACQGICCPCCLQSMNVYSPPGVLVGTIEEQWSIYANFLVRNSLGEVIFRINGPYCTTSFTCGNVDFTVMSADGEIELGQITKQWTGCLKEAFTDADNFEISFPLDLDVHMKATLLGALFLIDFMYYERSQNQ